MRKLRIPNDEWVRVALLNSSFGIRHLDSSSHLRHLLENRLGELNQSAQHPRQEDDDHGHDRERLRDEGQGLFVNGRDGLKDTDAQSDDHAGDQAGRGQGNSLEHHRFDQLDGELRIHEARTECVVSIPPPQAVAMPLKENPLLKRNALW